MNMETIIIGLDFVLIAVGLWMFWVVRTANLGGAMGQTLMFLALGALLLGFAHLSETIIFEIFKLSVEATEVIHRLTVLSGFVLLTVGLQPVLKLRQTQ
jgi:hypothetical protein